MNEAVSPNLLPVVKPIWVIRIVFRLTFHCSCSVSLGEVKVPVDGVHIQSQLVSI